jgi:hypothetical protein
VLVLTAPLLSAYYTFCAAMSSKDVAKRPFAGAFRHRRTNPVRVSERHLQRHWQRVAERCSTRFGGLDRSRRETPSSHRVVPSTNWEVERETGFEPATCSLEGRDGYA